MAYSIVVSLNSRRLSVIKDNRVIRSYPVGVGKPQTPTPTGSYQIVSKAPNPGGAYGGMWMGLSKPHYGIHGTNNPGSIGRQVSSGCIRMHNRDVTELSKLIPTGTPVIIKP